MRFRPAAIERHIRRKHPGCPDFAVRFFVDDIAKRDWTDATLGMAVGIAMQNVLRHTMTDYDALLREGMDRHEAKRRIQPKVAAMIARWKSRPATAIGQAATNSQKAADELEGVSSMETPANT